MLNLSFEEGIELIQKAIEKQAEERAFQLYVARYPWMTEKDFIPFEEFYKPPSRQVVTNNQTADEIILDVKNIMDNFTFERSR